MYLCFRKMGMRLVVSDLLGLPDPVGLGESENLDLPGLKDPAGLRNNSDLPGFKNPAGLKDLLGLYKSFFEEICRILKIQQVKTYRVWKTQQVMFLVACMFLFSCQQTYTPKPNAYFRIDFPEKEYRLYDSNCPFTFEYPVYGTLVPDTRPTSEPCWFNINFPKYKGTIYLSYLEINSNNILDTFIEDNWKMIFGKIAQKADAVDPKDYSNFDHNVYGTLFDINGNAASAVQFYVTDSVKNILRGSLYFYARPNQDSLAPAVAFFREDIVHLMESVRWKDVKLKK